jgi:ATP-binding protein involved in chromosome partitioning
MTDDKSILSRAQEALRGVKYPGFPRDIVTLGMVAGLESLGDVIRVNLRLPGGRTDPPAELKEAMAAALQSVGMGVEIRVATAPPPGDAQAGGGAEAEDLLPGVRNVLAVSSAKGGVGKSTVASNLACAFAAMGLRTGLLDADVHGPSLPIMMGTQERPHAAGGNRFHPVECHGVRCVSMGLFLDDQSPVIWRGPMVAGLLQQFLRDCEWGELDVLVVDLPPGTGDAQLTLAQQIPLAGALLVTTPQEVSVRDVVRGIRMFAQVQVPLLGLVENMSHFDCPGCGAREHLFGEGGGDRIAEEVALPILARIPVEPEIRRQGDAGAPLVQSDPAQASSQIFSALAGDLARRFSSNATTSAGSDA